MSKPEETDAPPSYSAATGAAASTSTAESRLDPAFFSTTLRAHLSDLPSRIRAASARNARRQTASDLASISLLVPHVESFLASAARRAARSSSRCGKPLVGSLILVPAAAVPETAKIGDLEERRREGEYVQVRHVRPAGSFFGASCGEKGRDVKGSAPSPRDPLANEASGELRVWDPKRDECFDSWGRFGEDARRDHGDETGEEGEEGQWSDEEREERRQMWWADEDAATRLASYLQPAALEPGKLERKAVQRTVAETRKTKKKMGFLGFGRSRESAPKRTEEVVVADEAPPAADRENVTLNCSAQELSFQHETDLGFYKSLRGWGIVMDVKIRGI